MIAIHKSSGFAERWVAYCEKNNIPYKLVNAYDNDIVSQVKDCDGFMWHHSQNNPKALIAAKPILFSLQQAGIKVFPDFNTAWHFDDKLGQKYLLEALKVPMVPSYVFLVKKEALDWACKTTYPKVFKLRGGAGSSNVKLVKNHSEAKKMICKAFGRGFSNYDAWGSLKERGRKWRLGKASIKDLLIGVYRLLIKPAYSMVAGKECGYVYFQDFISGNDSDIRVIFIGEKAFAIKRMVRKNDFRASGSGDILYEKKHFDDNTIRLAFDVHRKLKSQCTAMDFIFDSMKKPLLVEISYGFVPEGYDPCTGYWDADLNWHDGNFNPYGWIVEEILK